MIATQDINSAFEASRLKLQEAAAVLKDTNLTPEERTKKFDGLKTEAEALKADAMRLQDIERLAAEVKADYTGNGTFMNGGSQNPDTFDVEMKVPGSNFKSTNAFVKAVYFDALARRGDPGGRTSKNLVWFKEDERKTHTGPQETKDMVESVGASGGFLVPVETLNQVLSQMQAAALVRSRATIIRMRRRQIEIPVLNQTGTTAGIPHWFGGIRVYWTEEATAKTQSDASWRKISLVAHKLAGYTRVSDELLDDAVISLTDFLMGPMGFPGAIAWQEDYDFLNGNGVGRPLGIINAPCTITVARQNQGAIVYDDLVNMLENFLPSGRGVWLASQSAMSNLLLMNGPTGNPSYLWGNAVSGAPGQLLGMPIFFTEKLPRISTTSVGDLVLADLSYYLIGDRQATTMASTIYDQFQNDETSFRATHRVDGQPWLSTPFTYADGTSQVSPFVILGAKST